MSKFRSHSEKYVGLFLGMLLCLDLTACAINPTPTPNYTIGVQSTAQGKVAVAPECLNWTDNLANPYDNQPLPQLGCANARNLAFMVERPDDLIQGRDPGTSSGVLAVGAMRRYESNQTRGLLDLSAAPDLSLAVTSAPTAASSLNGATPPTSSSSGAAAGAP